MVQICASCNEKHSHLAEGNNIATSSIDGRFTPSDNKSQANSETSNVRFKVKKQQQILKVKMTNSCNVYICYVLLLLLLRTPHRIVL